MEENNYIPDNYEPHVKDDYNFFNSEHWSKGLTHDTNTSIK